MRIALLSSAANLHTRRWVEFFTGRGHELHLISIQQGDELGENQYALSNGDGINQLKVFGSAGKARRIIRDIDPEVVLGQYLPSHGLLAALVNRHPLVVVAWSPDIPYATDRHPYDRWRVRFILGRADLVLVCGRHLIPHAVRLGIDPRRAASTYVGVNSLKFKPGDDDARDSSLIFTNREHKNILHVDTLIRALPAVAGSFPGIRVVIANNGPLRRSLETLAVGLGVRDRCEFVGRSNPPETAEHLGRSLIYVSCSEVDGMSISLLEALACGAYPVISDIAANRELTDLGARADLFPVGDPSALAGRLIECLGDRSRINEGRLVNYEIFDRFGRLKDNLALVERRLLALVDGEQFVGEGWRPGPV